MRQTFKTLMAIGMLALSLNANAQNGKQLGGMKPEAALTYMQKTANIVIVDVREPRYIDNYFQGSIRIPWTEMGERFNEIPKGRPVILNCGLGWVAPKAYKILTEKRKDIPELSWIDGAPKFDEYNKWLKQQKKK